MHSISIAIRDILVGQISSPPRSIDTATTSRAHDGHTKPNEVSKQGEGRLRKASVLAFISTAACSRHFWNADHASRSISVAPAFPAAAGLTLASVRSKASHSNASSRPSLAAPLIILLLQASSFPPSGTRALLGGRESAAQWS